MAPRKLSDADKRDVIQLYKHPHETTSTIAERYGVSNSTISRILKQVLPAREYSALIAQKRTASTAERSGVESSFSQPAEPAVSQTPVDSPVSVAKEKPILRSRQPEASITSAQEDESIPTDSATATGPIRYRSRSRQPAADDQPTQLPLLMTDTASDWSAESELETDETTVAIEDMAEAAADLSETVDYHTLDDEDFEEEDDFEDEDDFDDDDDDGEPATLHVSDRSAVLQILPLQAAALPKTCYLVIDRLSELITLPLKEFADLGQIPAAAATSPTLPVFENHRVARRFSRRNQRVIKVPDGQLLTKTGPCLQAKGITHLLIDGKVYTLTGSES